MIELSAEIVTILLFCGILLGIMTGYPLAITIGAIALLVGFAIKGIVVFDLIYDRVFFLVYSYDLLAVPLFIFMGAMLENSRIAEKMYDALYLWLSGFRGGLAITTVVLGALLAACVGVIGASVTMLALIALPSMVKRGYSKSLASGAVCAGGTLGILIPPSVMLVIYGPMALISVGKLFFAAFIPGFFLALLYCSYIAVRCLVQPHIAPAITAEEEVKTSLLRKTMVLVGATAPTGVIIMAVLGTIFLGIAAPTEAAAVGAFTATALAAAYKRLTWRVLKDGVLGTFRITGMVFLIGGMSFAFVGVFLIAGCDEVIRRLVLNASLGPWGIFVIIMFVFFLLGFLIDWIGILFIMIPIISPLVPILGFDPLWFAMMICVNLQMSFMTPPFAPAIFYLRGSLKPEWGITITDIMRGVVPFVLLIMVELGLLVVFPKLILWLPGQMIQ